MKWLNRLLIGLCVCGTTSIYSQNWVKNLKEIHSQDELSTFLVKNPLLDVEELTFVTLKDSGALTQKVFAKNIGDVFLEDSSTYKIWSEVVDTALYFRVNYIYLNAKVRTKHQIDSLRPLIIQQYKQGTPFQTLVTQYTMDGNLTGDLGWFQAGVMIPEFEAAVRKAVTGSIFTVDVPENDWFYVVLKTHDQQMAKTRTVLKVTE
jgi:hypothetical protein